MIVPTASPWRPETPNEGFLGAIIRASYASRPNPPQPEIL
jgi:hypothetical protein